MPHGRSHAPLHLANAGSACEVIGAIESKMSGVRQILKRMGACSSPLRVCLKQGHRGAAFLLRRRDDGVVCAPTRAACRVRGFKSGIAVTEIFFTRLNRELWGQRKSRVKKREGKKRAAAVAARKRRRKTGRAPRKQNATQSDQH